MADRVTIRNSRGDEKTVAKTAVPFFPGYVVLDKTGRKAAHQPTSANKEN